MKSISKIIIFSRILSECYFFSSSSSSSHTRLSLFVDNDCLNLSNTTSRQSITHTLFLYSFSLLHFPTGSIWKGGPIYLGLRFQSPKNRSEFGHIGIRFFSSSSSNVPHTKGVGISSYLSVVDIVVRGKWRRGQIAGDDNRLARVEHMMTGLDEDIGSSYDVVLGSFASAITSASSRRIVGEVYIARLWHKDTLHIKWRQSLVSRRQSGEK